MPGKRITAHPILGEFDKGERVGFTLDGKEASGFEGEPIAAALAAMGVSTLRFTKRRNRPRGLFCGIGRCTDCGMAVDGEINVRTCRTPLRAGMDIKTQRGAEKP
jgi:predicted molibdopterin-dependent oxidoreductase YjgC